MLPRPVFRILAVACAGFSLLVPPAPVCAGTFSTVSPDGRIRALVEVSDSLRFSVSLNGRSLVEPSTIALRLADHPFPALKVVSVRTDSADTKIIPVVPEKRSVIPDVYRQTTITLEGGFALIVRAYDDGVAYRFRTSLKRDITVQSEQMTLMFAKGDSVWFGEEQSFLTHSERIYTLRDIAAIPDTQFCCLPAVVAAPSGVRIAVTESDLLDYPGMYLRGTGRGAASLTAIFPAYPAEEKPAGDRTVRVTRREPWLAHTTGTRTFPWRVFGIAERDGGLIENDIVYRLGSPLALTETGWIKPGKVAWDWWNANNISGVPFKSGVNTETYKFYIDFASANHLAYVIFDEGWSKPSDLFEINPAMDMDALFAHARQKDVGIILWMTWNALDARLDEALDRFAAWGAKGIKVDFMQRDDQKMVNYYERVARAAAKRHLLVDFHGAYKPTGFSRTFPHALTREGVHGLENDKWTDDVTPAHDVTLPFTRMFAGAMDYTPGATRNAAQGCFKPIFDQPMSQGTRVHQMAMYVVYESPLQMLSDAPSAYMREPEMMEFLSAVPTTWDETRCLNAAIGRYLTVARRKGDTWYIGAMGDWTPRTLELNTDFLGDAPHSMTAWEDGANADRCGSDFVRSQTTVQGKRGITIHLAPGGGWAAILRPSRPAPER